MARVIAFSNIKGGSGKTTTTVNISAALAHRNNKVLLIDTDPQAHATLSLGKNVKTVKRDLLSILIEDHEITSVILNTDIANLKLIPASKRLVSFEKNYSRSKEARLFLSEKVKEITDQYDFITIDTPPTISLLTFSALISADEIIIPVQAHFLGMKGIFDMVRLLYKINQIYKTELVLSGIIPTFFNEKMRLSKAVVKEVRNNLGQEIFLHPVRNNISLAEAPMFGKSIFQYNKNSIGAADYLQVAIQIEEMAKKDETKISYS